MKTKIMIAMIALFALPALMLTLAQSAPQLINFQGRLTNPAGQPLDGVTVDMTFSFYGAEAGSTAYLSVLQPDILVTAGIYNVLLGSGPITPGAESSLASVFQNHTDVWMGIKVDAEAEMTPRQRITSVPFALQSSNASFASSIDYATLSATIWNDPDHDGDGRNSILLGGLDCNDGDPNSFPGAVEIVCDGIDQNCDHLDARYENIKITNDLDFGNGLFPSLSFTGSEFAVSWNDHCCGWDYPEIYFSRISMNGSKTGTDVRITSGGEGSYYPSLSWTGSEFGVSWHDQRDGNSEIYFARVSAAGAKVGADLRITSYGGYSWNPSLSWTGSEFGVSWADSRDGNWEIYFARVSAAGAKVGADERITSAGGESYYPPSLSWTGSEFGVSWHDDRDGNLEIYFARVSAAGAKIGADERITSYGGYSWYPSLSWTGSEFGVSWYDGRDGNYEIYFARVSAAGAKVGADSRITSDGGGAYDASLSLSWTGSEFGVSWIDSRDGNYEIYFARISPAGSKIGADSRITSDGGYSWGRGPSLSWTGSAFGVSWVDNRDGNSGIYFARVVECP